MRAFFICAPVNSALLFRVLGLLLFVPLRATPSNSSKPNPPFAAQPGLTRTIAHAAPSARQGQRYRGRVKTINPKLKGKLYVYFSSPGGY